MASVPENAVEVRGLTKVFGTGETAVEAIRGVDLDIRRGEFVAVMGASGSGKSTLLHLVAGLDQATSGTVQIGDSVLSTLDDDQLTLLRRKRIGLIFQAFNLMDVLTAEENVALPLWVDGVPHAEAQRKAAETLAAVGLDRRRHHLPRTMSGGEQQRVAIARALVNQPLILLADEPTGNLDSTNGDLVMHLLRDLVDRSGQTICMVTHDARHAEMADRIIVLRDGKIVEQRTLREVPAVEPNAGMSAVP